MSGTSRKPTHELYLSIQSFALSAAVWPELQCLIMYTQFDPVQLLGWTQWIANGANRNVDPTFLFDLCAHYRPILHRLATIHKRQTDERQNNRKRPPVLGIVGLNKQRA